MVLIVPKVYQRDENACLPACIKMVLDYYIQTGKVRGMEEQTVDNIRRKSQVQKTRSGEYSLMNFGNCFALNNFLNQYGLNLNFGGPKTVQDIKNLLNSNKPPILVYNPSVYLKQIGYLDDIYEHTHALVVKDLNIDKNEVSINDSEKVLDKLDPFNLSALIESWTYFGALLIWVSYVSTQGLDKWFGGVASGKE